jgi:LmbE family N-acetylglucosaminyl deacetylase
MTAPAAGQRVVVVSPHSDDGVLSLGASMAAWRRAGVRVELLTVLALDPHSEAPSGGWDRRAGFRTEGEAARVRRAEDAAACSVLGAEPAWLPFGSVDYDRHGADEVRRAVGDEIEGAALVLLPGFPLRHPDHAWLARTLVSDLKSDTVLALYAEQPYTRRAGAEPRVPASVADAIGATPVFVPTALRPQDRLAKWRAIGEYRSQLPLLGMHRSVRRGRHQYALAPEWVAWGGN